MSKYKVIIFDLDGTAIPNMPNGLPSAVLVEAIKTAQSKIKLCAATGRPITNAKAILESLTLTDPCVISAGTQIIDPQSGEVLWEVSIETADVKEILDICKPYHYELLVRNELLGEGASASARQVEGDVNVMYLMGCSEKDAAIILKKLSKIPTITAAGVTSWTQQGVDIHITNVSATKEHAIAELLKMLGLDKENAVGVGDANNDVHLFKAVGRRVAMGNATNLLKAQADEICKGVDENGLAQVIEKYSKA